MTLRKLLKLLPNQQNLQISKSALIYTMTSTSAAMLAFIDNSHTLIGVDGGAEFLIRNGHIPHLIIGDMDTATPDIIAPHMDRLIKFSAEKAKTDTELAIDWCASQGIKQIKIFNPLADRFDHSMGIIANLLYAHSQGINTQIISLSYIAMLLTKQLKFNAIIGTTVSFIPLSSLVRSVSVRGFKYPLKNTDLYQYSTRGISNITATEELELTCTDGQLLVIINKGEL